MRCVSSARNSLQFRLRRVKRDLERLTRGFCPFPPLSLVAQYLTRGPVYKEATCLPFRSVILVSKFIWASIRPLLFHTLSMIWPGFLKIAKIHS